MGAEHDITFHSMGSDVRLLIGMPLSEGQVPPDLAAERERAYVEDFASRLSRFERSSELSVLNHDPSEAPSVSRLLATAVSAGVWAAQRSGGLVDPTLMREIEQIGYETSHDGRVPASLEEALTQAPARRRARPRAHEAWRAIEVVNGRVRRPAGLKIDTGGVGKGLCADAVAYRLRHYSRYVVDCGGDLTIGGVGAQIDPYEVAVEHPLSGQRALTLLVGHGGVATSGLNVRVWQRSDGSFAHHLLDPSTGEPAWTGLIGVTALAATALEAETLSKTALLLGPTGARDVLAAKGGVIFYDDGEMELVGPAERPHGVLTETRQNTATRSERGARRDAGRTARPAAKGA